MSYFTKKYTNTEKKHENKKTLFFRFFSVCYEKKKFFCQTQNVNDSGLSTARLNITKAEAKFADFIVDLNLPLSAADTITKTMKKALPDSEIARGYKCSRSKTTAMV